MKGKEMRTWSGGGECRIEEGDVDEIAQPREALDAQMFECVAEMNAAEDALFFLDRCLAKGAIDLKTYLRQVRNTSREQFFRVALSNRILEVQARQRAGGNPSSTSSPSTRTPTPPPTRTFERGEEREEFAPLTGYPEL